MSEHLANQIAVTPPVSGASDVQAALEALSGGGGGGGGYTVIGTIAYRLTHDGLNHADMPDGQTWTGFYGVSGADLGDAPDLIVAFPLDDENYPVTVTGTGINYDTTRTLADILDGGGGAGAVNVTEPGLLLISLEGGAFTDPEGQVRLTPGTPFTLEIEAFTIADGTSVDFTYRPYTSLDGYRLVTRTWVSITEPTRLNIYATADRNGGWDLYAGPMEFTGTLRLDLLGVAP